MKDDMSSYNLVNLKKFIKRLSGERYKTFIVYSGPVTGKSRYARQFAKDTGCKYLDLLKKFGEDERLKSRIDIFDIRELEKLLIKEARGANLLILDNSEFLLNTWNEDSYDLLFHLLRQNWDSFKTSYQATLGVFLTSNRKILDIELITSKRDTRVFHLNKLESLEGGPEHE